MEEQWKVIPETGGRYAVSDLGRVRRETAAKGTRPGRVLRFVTNHKGYHEVRLNLGADSVYKIERVHTLVMRAFVGPRPDSAQVNHINGIKTDNRPSNLEYVTQSENQIHRFHVLGQSGRKGEAHGMAKLTEDSVRAIRRLHASGIRQCELARLYEVTPQAVWLVIKRKKWAHVD